MEIKLAEPHAPEWNTYVENHPQAGFYHLNAWREVLTRCFGHETFYLMAMDRDRVCGVLPLVHLKSRLFGSSLVSLPYFMTGGVVADSADAATALIERARALMDTTKSKLLLIRQQNSEPPGLLREDSKGSFHIALDPDPEKVFQRFERQVRRQIRKAQRAGLAVEWGARCLPDFYEVYSTNMRDLGIPIHGYGFYETVLERFPESAHVFVVRHGEKAVAGQFLFTYRDRVMLANAGSLRSHLSLCPNHLLYWESIRYGCENGYQICDFGRSPKGSGPYVFKSQWAGAERDYPTYYLDASGQAMSGVRADNSRYDLVRKIWRSLPVRLTTLVGPRIVKALP